MTKMIREFYVLRLKLTEAINVLNVKRNDICYVN